MFKNFKKNHREAYEWIEAGVAVLSCFGMIFCTYMCLWMIG
jgi:hypothetical protein